MRKLIFFFAILPAICQAQDPCNSIRRDMDKGSIAAAYTSPKAPVMASKRVMDQDTTIYLTFTIEGKRIAAVSPRGENLQPQVKGLTVVFEDGSTYSSDTASVAHSMRGGRSVYRYVLPVDGTNFSLFTAQKIRQFSLGGLTETNIGVAGSIPDYLRCLDRKRF